MEHPEHHQTASRALQDVVDKNTRDLISFYELKTSLHERGFGLLLLIFSLPLVLVPPGLTAVAALPVLIFSIQMLFGMDSPWLPRWLGNKNIQRTTLAHIVEKSSPTLKKIERLLRPRLEFASSRTGERIIGIFATLFSISIAIPLPLTNLVPSIGIAIMALGLLGRDGLTIIIGMIVGSIGCIVTTLVLVLGASVTRALLSKAVTLFGG